MIIFMWIFRLYSSFSFRFQMLLTRNSDFDCVSRKVMIVHKTHPRRKIVFIVVPWRKNSFKSIFGSEQHVVIFVGESVLVFESARCPFCEPLRPPLPAQPLQHRFPIFIAEIPTFWNDNLFLIVLILRSNCWCENPQNEKFKLTKAPGRDGKSENGKNSINISWNLQL